MSETASTAAPERSGPASLASKALSVLQRDVFLFFTNLATGVVVARSLGPTALGWWVILQLVPSYAESLGRLKLDAAAVYMIGRRQCRPEDVLLGINVMALASSVLLMALIWWQIDWLAAVIFGAAAGEVRAELTFLLLQIPLQFLYLNYAYVHIANEDIAIYNRMVLIRALTQSVLAVGLLLGTALDLWAVVIASVASFGAGLLYGWWTLDRSGFRKAQWSWPLIRELASYGMHLYAGGVLGQVSAYGTRSVIVFLLAPMQVAFYGLAQGAAQFLDRIPQALGTVMFPRISRSEAQRSVQVAANAFRVAAIFLCAGMIALEVLADVLVALMYGVKYAPAARALRIMLPGVMLAGVASTLLNFFQASGRADLVPKVQLGPIVLQILAAVALSRLWGLNGAALALCIGMACGAVIQIAVFLRVTGSRLRDLIPGTADWRQILDLTTHSLGKLGLVR